MASASGENVQGVGTGRAAGLSGRNRLSAPCLAVTTETGIRDALGNLAANEGCSDLPLPGNGFDTARWSGDPCAESSSKHI